MALPGRDAPEVRSESGERGIELLGFGGGRGGPTMVAAAFGALLFALHPLRVESVTWVTERRDVLCGVF